MSSPYVDQWLIQSTTLCQEHDIHRVALTIGRFDEEIQDIARESLDRIKRYIEPSIGHDYYLGHHVHYESNEIATDVQRKFNAVFKLFYDAGCGSITFKTIKSDESKVVRGKNQRCSTFNYIRDFLMNILTRCQFATDKDLLDMFKEVCNEQSIIKHQAKTGWLYVMSDIDSKGQTFYKIGETSKNPEERLQQLISSKYLSSQSKVLLKKEHHDCQWLEAYLQLKYFSKKFECPNRQTRLTGSANASYRRQCDETYRLSKEDVEFLMCKLS